MAVIRINQFEAKAGAEARLHDFLGSVIDLIRHSPGCMSCRLLRSSDNPACLAIIEEWDSIAAHQQAARSIPPAKMAEAMALFARPASGMYYLDGPLTTEGAG